MAKTEPNVLKSNYHTRPDGYENFTYDQLHELLVANRTRYLGKLFNRGGRLNSAYVEHILTRHGHPGVRKSMIAVLGNIDENGTTTVEVAERLCCTKQAVSKGIKDMIEMGYVSTKPHPTDARAQLIVVTPRGYELIRAIGEAFYEVQDFVEQHLGKAKMELALQLLNELIELPWPVAPSKNLE